MYTEIALILSETYSILGFPVLVSLPLICYQCKIKVHKSDLHLLLLLFSITLLSIIFATKFINFSIYPIKILQFYVALITGIVTLKVTEKNSLAYQQRILFNTSTLITIGLFLESNDLLFVKQVSDYVRSVLYEGGLYALYVAGDRDLAIVGFNRPKFFTSEPSLAALGYFVFSTAFLVINTNYWRIWLILLFNILCFTFSGSPTLLLTFIVWGWLFSVKTKVNWLIVALVALCLLGFLFAFVSPDVLTSKLSARILSETFSPNTSLYSRLYVAYAEALPTAITYNPFFGVGFAGKELLTSISDLAYVSDDIQFILGTNSFSRFFTFFGLLGMAVFLFSFRRYFQHSQISNFFTIFLVWFLFSQMIGAMETSRYWMYLFLIIGLSKQPMVNEKIKVPSFKISA